MELIEQAIFTSAETDRSAGYQVVAATPGVGEADARELAVWGPSHDALLDSAPKALSLNFHPLPSGNFCVSRTTPAGWEYSGRGTRVYTQCLIVPPQVLARFANNPFALVRAALAGGMLKVHDDVPKRLEPLRLLGRAAAVDSALLARLCAKPGPDWLASLVQGALSSATVALAGDLPAENLIAGLLNCLPPECRTEFSFSTGLKFSSRRPFRVVALSEDGEEQRRVERLYKAAVLNLSGNPPAEFSPLDSWPRFIHRVLKSGRISLLATQLSDRQGEFSPEDLPALGLQLLEELDATSLGSGAADEEAWVGEAVAERGPGSAPPAAPRDRRPKGAAGQEPPAQRPLPARAAQRAHASHGRSEQESATRPAARCQVVPPSQVLHPDDPHVLETLERLDDLVYEAISGERSAMDQLRSLWLQAREELGGEMLAESREQYLRYALSIWEECVEPGIVRDPARAVQSLDVLCVLFNQA